MKAILFFAASLAAATGHATVRTVNNNNPSPGQYSSLAAAHNAASAGDTLYIHPSPTNYGNLTISKRLTLMGAGHKPQSTDPQTAKLDIIQFNGQAASRSRIISLDLEYVFWDGNSYSVNAVTITRCNLRTGIYIYANVDTMYLEGNVFAGTGENIAMNFAQNYDVRNFFITNNVFNGHLSRFYPSVGAGASIYLRNNLFTRAGSLFRDNNGNPTDNGRLIFQNNIFYRTTPTGGPGEIANSEFSNNLSYLGSPATAGVDTFSEVNGNFTSPIYPNLEGVNPLFVSYPAPGAAFSYSHDYNLQPASPARSAGTDGRDIGLTGGNGYFQKFGTPPIPVVHDLQITSPANATILPGGTLQVNLKSNIGR